MVIEWAAPDIRGSSITAYEIQLKTQTGDFIEVTDLCDGSIEQVVTEMQCSFEMLDVLEDPLWLEQGDLIVAKVRAINQIGYGEYSSTNTLGQMTEKKPATPAFAPVMIS